MGKQLSRKFMSHDVELTEDMAQTLCAYFSSYEKDGVVTLESNDLGLWLKNHRSNSRQFLGRARLPDNQTVGAIVH
ncbi:MAG: hypothetical protein IME92_04530 [Proteobacteria bacterium]|nr:hypothetical protein [Pseudomonadota bacterium]